ncbi:hypothetical protein [Priestia sp. YIM B13489]|uniref:hypothetical protein n=1 Tax=Priestia sp. YIM B13489 TaxID=3366313 RepID=UPI003670EDEE
MENLNNQFYVYSVDTAAFYHVGAEQTIHAEELRTYNLRKKVSELIKNEAVIKESKKEIKGEVKLINDNKTFVRVMNKKKLKRIVLIRKGIKFLTKRIDKIKAQLKDALGESEGMRTLRSSSLLDKQRSGLFDSVLSRTLGIKAKSTTTDIIIVQSYYEKVLEDLIKQGFVNEDGEQYVFYSAFAGQIRQKKNIFLKKSVWDEHQKSLMCGLTVDDINAKGGMNINKFLAYLALSNSATSEWKDFNIDHCIVVDDMETNVSAIFDVIDTENFTIDHDKRKGVDIEHTDGSGLILPSLSDKAFMVRLPFVKGLLIPTPFDKFAKEVAGNTKVTDIYGKEWDIIEDNVQIIFTKSQFKLWKFYIDTENKENSWNNYKQAFKDNKCQAGKLNEEESKDNFSEAVTTYQVLQTLYNMKKSDLEGIAEETNKFIKAIGREKEAMLNLMGADNANTRKNAMQEAISIYPELLSDKHVKQTIKATKASFVKRAKSGKLKVQGKYTFVSPDTYAFCEWLFQGNKNPEGLLNDGEVYCTLFEEGRLCLERSPHLFLEHALRDNVIDDKKKEWFVSNAIYTSCLDAVSRTLQFDNDGDSLLVISCPKFIKIAEEHMEGINPLYYEMKKAEAEQIKPDSIYTSLKAAYKANIGTISNKITKIFNSSDKKDINVDTVRLLCCLNNFEIDYAKTLFKPTIPTKALKKQLNAPDKLKAPYFFQYAKKKTENQVEKINDSVVNQLEHVIKDTNVFFKKVVGEVDYKLLMNDCERRTNNKIIDLYTKLDRSKKWLMLEQKKADIKSYNKLWIYEHIREDLLKINNDPYLVADVLVKHLFHTKNSAHKTTLWESFGGEILNSLYKNLNKSKVCVDCDKKFIPTTKRQDRCSECKKKHDAKLARERQRKSRAKKAKEKVSR